MIIWIGGYGTKADKGAIKYSKTLNFTIPQPAPEPVEEVVQPQPEVPPQQPSAPQVQMVSYKIVSLKALLTQLPAAPDRTNLNGHTEAGRDALFTPSNNEIFKVDSTPSTLANADLVYGFNLSENHKIMIADISGAADAAITELKFDNRFDIDGDGKKDTILFKDGASANEDSSVYAVIHGLETDMTSDRVDNASITNFQKGNFIATDGSHSSQQILVGTDSEQDIFTLDSVGQKLFDIADMIYEFDSTTDKIRFTEDDGTVHDLDELKFDRRFDLDGDGTNDTILFTSDGRAFDNKVHAIIHGLDTDVTTTMLDGTTEVTPGNFAVSDNSKAANEPALLIGQGNNSRLRVDQPSGKGLEYVDVVLNFTSGRINAVKSTGSRESFRELKYDSRFDFDSDGNNDTIFFVNHGTGPTAYAIIDSYTHLEARQIAEYHTTKGSAPRQQILVGKTNQVDTFELQDTPGKMADANLIFGFEDGDQITIGFQLNQDVFLANSINLGKSIEFDNGQDVTGDGLGDTVIHDDGKVLAVIVGQEIDLTDDHFTQSELSVVSGEFV